MFEGDGADPGFFLSMEDRRATLGRRNRRPRARADGPARPDGEGVRFRRSSGPDVRSFGRFLPGWGVCNTYKRGRFEKSRAKRKARETAPHVASLVPFFPFEALFVSPLGPNPSGRTARRRPLKAVSDESGFGVRFPLVSSRLISYVVNDDRKTARRLAISSSVSSSRSIRSPAS